MIETRMVRLLDDKQTKHFERARKRVRFALEMAENDLLDYDAVVELCRGLSLALRDLDAINSTTSRELYAA